MVLSSKVAAVPGVLRFSAMMGTLPNKALMRGIGMYAPELDEAGAGDICVVIEAENEEAKDRALVALEELLTDQVVSAPSAGLPETRSWDAALKALPRANLALLSIPGMYAAAEAKKALDSGLSVFMFSDNVSVEDELELKRRAAAKGLLFMGPDCGTGILDGIPVAFANKVRRGCIGAVAASGTGLQEITSLIDHHGEGVSSAIGTGGRDLSQAVGGLSMLAALDRLAADPGTRVVVVASKPPAAAVRDAVVARLKTLGKPVVALFIGEAPTKSAEGDIHYAHTLEDAAGLAVELARSLRLPAPGSLATLSSGESGALAGLYSGGTLAAEAGMLLAEAFGQSGGKSEEVLWKLGKHEIIDLGEDFYTRGRPHPMIDPTLRLAKLREKALAPETRVVLFDVVLGYGAHPDMGGVLAAAVRDLGRELEGQERAVRFVATVCGTDKDPQNYEKQAAALREAGVDVCASNSEAVRTAIGWLRSPEREEAASLPILGRDLAVVNVGLRGFAEDLAANGCPVVHYEWRPVAGGDERLAKLLDNLK